MSEHALDRSQSGLLAVIQMLLSAQELEDVRGAVAHGAKLVCRFDTLSLYEVTPSGRLDRTLRRGNELAPGAMAVEDMLAGRVAKTSRTASTLDRFVDDHEQALADGYVSRHGLCLARPLQVYGEFVGVLVFHFESRTALPDTEFDSLRRFVEFAAVALSNARTRAELRGFAYSDPLTGLANRRRLEVEFARLQGTPLSLLLVDFDGLKAVNDSLGYHRGDDLIKAVATKLGAGAGADEFVVRYGGDEFVIVLPGVSRAVSTSARSSTGQASAMRRHPRATISGRFSTALRSRCARASAAARPTANSSARTPSSTSARSGPSAAARGPRHLRRAKLQGAPRSDLAVLVGREREVDDERRSLACPRAGRDLSSVRARDRRHDREAEAGPAACA